MERTASRAAPAGTQAVLAAEGLVKRFGVREALRGVSFEAGRGELVAVIGPNGAGKTTLLSILAGIQRADEGYISRAPREVGWVPQQAAVYGKLTVEENLELFARLERAVDRPATVQRMLDLTGLRDRAGDQVAKLSGGNRQRVNIAVGLLGEPEVLLLDEPSASLDPRQRARLWEFILALADEGTTVLYSTHDVQEAERHADQVVVLADGELLFAGTPRALEDTVGEASAAPGEERSPGVAGGAQPERWSGEHRTDRSRASTGAFDDFESAFVAFLHQRGH
ncbi:MAG: ABC transporter ATP-binding protein [Actinomycetota bacterium]|nr:ABC transporter ATP-binding protein [Actinomycetota bacterium]